MIVTGGSVNKVYVTKKGVFVVSVICKSIRKNITSRVSMSVLLVSLLGGGYFVESTASVVDSRVNYQTYRDFSENKGLFKPGAENITLYDNNGNVVTTLNKAPMIDFSSNDRTGVATLVSPQYVVSVKHNSGYQNVKFGYGDDTSYTLVDRNNHWLDFHNPRLNKIVTEVSVLDMTEAGTVEGTYQNQKRFPVFYRIGTGTQYVKDASGKLNYLVGAYSYKTGGLVNPPFISDWSFVTNTTNMPLSTYGTPGDSGSPLFAWDVQQNKWVVTGVLNSYAGVSGNTNWYTIIPVEDVANTMKLDADTLINTQHNGGDIYWDYDNKTSIGTLSQDANSWSMHGNQGPTWPASLNSGKDLTFQGGGSVILENTVDQGAGTLTFDDDYIIKSLDSQTWKGGGIIVNNDHTVDWQVNGIQGDNLHKLGTGTLKVNGTGINPGGLNVGEGTVVMAQRPDNDDNVQAFNNVSIVSGRPTVVLSDDKQVNPDNIKWGYRGGKLDISGNNLTFHQLNGADDGAILTNTGKQASVNLDFNKVDTTMTAANIWHGHFTGNVDVKNTVTPGTQNDFVMDGGMNTQGNFTQQNGRLFIQGHPVIHAVSTQAVADKLKALGDNSVLIQPVSFTQSDWEVRQFRLKQLNLYNADFNLARNASLHTNIKADQSSVTLGSEDLYIDLNDGNGVKTTPSFGKSKAINDADQSRFTGHVQLNNGSTLNINEYFSGGIDSIHSSVRIASSNAVLNQFSRFSHSPLSLVDGAKLTVTSGLFSDSEVNAGAGSTLSLLSGVHSAECWCLNGLSTTLNVGAGNVITGNIQADDAARLYFGTAEDASEELFAASYGGNLSAPLAGATMANTLWQTDGQSVVKALDLKGSLVRFGNIGAAGSLTVNTLTASNSQFIMNTDGKTADTITVKQSLAGKNNVLVVVPSVASMSNGTSPIALVTAPKTTDTGVFSLKSVAQRTGVHIFTPQISIVDSGNSKQWRLEGFDVQPDNVALKVSKSVMHTGYKNFLTEMNNLNYRMGDLRNTHGETGAWARVFSGTGSADMGYSDSWTHLQIGADRKHAFDGGDLFTGVTATFTHSNSHGDGWFGQTKSTGIGLYASAMFNSGLYVDAIGKYVRHNNLYSASETGMQEQDYRSYSWYLEAETGWRFLLPGETFIQPQTELVYGSVSGTRFDWQSVGSISMQRKQENPLIGRTGMESGKTFRGKDWELTTLAGIYYQYDLFNPAETIVHDIVGETNINTGKDNRVKFSLGVNAKIKEKTGISLNIERSALGHYDIENAINANIRYSF